MKRAKLKLTGKDYRRLRIPPGLEAYCVFCRRDQPEHERADKGHDAGWCYVTGTGGHMVCPQCAEKKLGVTA